MALIQNGQQDGSQEFFNIRGINIVCDSSAVFTGGCVYLNGVFTNSSIENSEIEGTGAYHALHITSTVSTNGGTNVISLINTEVNCIFAAGCGSELIDASGTGVMSSINHYGGGIENPGVGQYAIDIEGYSDSSTHNIGYFGTQVQGTNSNALPDLTVSTIYVKNAQNVTFKNMLVNSQPNNQYTFELAESVTGGLSNFVADSIRSNAASPILHNDKTGYSSTIGDVVLSHYQYTGTSVTERVTFDGPNNFTNGANLATAAQGPQYAAGSSLLYNGTMAGSGSVANGWSSGCTGACTFSLDNTTVPSAAPAGSQSQKIQITAAGVANVTANNASPAKKIAVTAGQRYVVWAAAKNDGTSGMILTPWLNSSAHGTLCFNDKAWHLTGSWTLYSETCTVASSATDAVIEIYTNNSTGTVWIYGAGFAPLNGLIAPFFSQTSLLLSSGTGLSAVTTTDSTNTNGNVIIADGSGNHIDSHTSLSSLVAGATVSGSIAIASGQTSGTFATTRSYCVFSAANAAAMTDLKANGAYGPPPSSGTFTLTLGAAATGSDVFSVVCK